MTRRLGSLISYVLVAITTVTAVVEVVAQNGNVVHSITNDLPFDDNGKLFTHIVVYPGGNPKCGAAHLPRNTFGFESYALAGEALQAVFPGANERSCRAACLEKGTDRSVAHAVMPYRHWHGLGDFFGWFQTTCKKAEVCLLNYRNRQTPLKVFWISPQTGKKQFQMELQWGERSTKCFSSFIGHVFEIEDGENGELLERITVEHTTTKAIGLSPPSGNSAGRNFDSEIQRTLRNEWRRHNRVTRTFSPLGFRKGRLPDDIFASMGSFYYNNRHNTVNEEWGGKGVFVNWWETNCAFIQIPWELKSKWQFRLRELVEAWAGVPVEQTDMYGLRQYESGARLLTHVDREATHAVSLIVNIAQGNLTEPWPVEVNDHGDRLHEVVMEPGDIVYYESAKCLHGRNRPLTGPNAYYVNLFTHYRPTGDPKWFNKPNDEDSPDPVVDVEGDCHLEHVPDAEAAGNQRAVVKCKDERLGDSRSPTLFKANSAEDLIEWWRLTTPPRGASKSSGGKDEL